MKPIIARYLHEKDGDQILICTASFLCHHECDISANFESPQLQKRPVIFLLVLHFTVAASSEKEITCPICPTDHERSKHRGIISYLYLDYNEPLEVVMQKIKDETGFCIMC